MLFGLYFQIFILSQSIYLKYCIYKGLFQSKLIKTRQYIKTIQINKQQPFLTLRDIELFFKRVNMMKLIW